MRLSALLLAVCSIVGPAAAQESSTPTAVLPELAARPADASDTSAWKKVEVEGPVTSRLAQALASGSTFAAWLVRSKICAPDAKECTFGIRYRGYEENPEQDASRSIAQYAVRGASGAVVQGYAQTRTSDIATHQYWSHDGTAWKLRTDEKEREAENRLIGQLIDVVNFLVTRGQLKVVQ